MPKKYHLRLYLSGKSEETDQLIKKLREALETRFPGTYELEIVDVLKEPRRAEEDKIMATPTLMRALPPPVRKIIGALSDREKVLVGLDLG